MIILVDDGTLDTVLQCDVCNEQMRYNFDGEKNMQGFIAWAISDAHEAHVCYGEEEGA